MKNVWFKLRFPAEFHARTAVECALALHPLFRGRLGLIQRNELRTQQAALRIIDKTGPLSNYADRDPCLQYIVAVALIFGRLSADDYGDAVAADGRIDAFGNVMMVTENEQFTRDYFDPRKRYMGNSIQFY